MKLIIRSRIFFLLALFVSITFFNKDIFAFSDVANSDFKVYIEQAHKAGIINGYSDDTFRPKNNVTLVEALKIATKTGNRKDLVKNQKNTEKWYTPYKNLYTQKDFQNEKIFDDNEAISRDFALYIILRQLDIKLKNFTSENKNFADIDEKSVFAPYVQFAKDTKIISGYSDGTFGANQKINRGEFAKMVWKILREDKEKILKSYQKISQSQKNLMSTPVYKLSQSEIRKGLLQAINTYRQANGVAPLKASKSLDIIALEYAQDMSGRGFFSHTSPDGKTLVDRAQQKKYKAVTLAENLGRGQKTIAQVMREWKASPTHNKNLLLPDVTVVGFGYSSGYWVQEFAKPHTGKGNFTGRFVARR
ncbi:S-layer homology domain-containing protein [Candidatus Gracilibacteria bacterium]|nr:S-layer homology domain-containing protein [Candidatus Gracilibacteria bacterium]